MLFCLPHNPFQAPAVHVWHGGMQKQLIFLCFHRLLFFFQIPCPCSACYVEDFQFAGSHFDQGRLWDSAMLYGRRMACKKLKVSEHTCNDAAQLCMV